MDRQQRTLAIAQQLNCARNELTTKSVVEEAEMDDTILFLLLQESWNNKDGHPPESPLFYLFTASNKDTKCATYIRKYNNLKPKHHFVHDNFIVSVTVEIQQQKTQILNIYSPGRSGPFANISRNITTIQNCLVMGDFNCHHQLWYGHKSHEYTNTIRSDKRNATRVKRWMDRQKLHLLNEPGEFTHFPRNNNRPTIIDLTLVKGPVLDYEMKWNMDRHGAGSDHRKTTIHIQISKPQHVPRRLWHKTDWETLDRLISQFHLPPEAWENQNHTEQSADFILEYIDQLIDRLTPLSNGHKKSKRWWTTELKTAKANLNTLERRARNTQREEDREALRKGSRNWTNMVRKAKAEQREKELSEAKGSTIWKIMNAGRKRETIIPTIQGEETFAGSAKLLGLNSSPQIGRPPKTPLCKSDPHSVILLTCLKQSPQKNYLKQ
jgi:hypothetical protein